MDTTEHFLLMHTSEVTGIHFVGFLSYSGPLAAL